MVGRNCKRLRQRAGLTQDSLAERLHVTRQAVSAWETGKNQPDVETLTALAEALGADVRELIYGPGAVREGYTRFQRRYVACTVLCAVVVVTWLVMELSHICTGYARRPLRFFRDWCTCWWCRPWDFWRRAA